MRTCFESLGTAALADLRPSPVQAWLRGLQQVLAPRYVRVIFANLSAVLANCRWRREDRPEPVPGSVGETAGGAARQDEPQVAHAARNSELTRFEGHPELGGAMRLSEGS